MMDSYTSGMASQNNPFVPYVAFGDGVIPQQQKVAETLTQEVTFLLFPSRRLCFGERPPCFFPKVSSLPLSFPMISFIPCGFLISPASSGLSSDRYGLIATAPLPLPFRVCKTPRLLALVTAPGSLYIRVLRFNMHGPFLLLCRMFSEFCR